MMHLYFAPLEGITTYPYRNLHHKYFGGVDKYFTPFLAPGPEQGMSVKEMRDVLPENNAGVPVVPQILTNRAGDFLLASKKLAEMGYREINLNLGCPSGTVTAKKKGSGFLLYPDDLDRFFDEVFSDASVRNGEFQISVKTRIGKNEVEEWPEIMAIYNRYPISELTVHPRIQKEFYKGVPHLDVFADNFKDSRNLRFTPFDEFVHIFFEFYQLLGYGGVQSNHGTGTVCFRTYGAELKTVSGEGERTGAVTVGIVNQ